MHINWHLLESPTLVTHVGILNGGGQWEEVRRSEEEERKKERGSLLSCTEVHCVVSPLLCQRSSCRPRGLLPVWLTAVLNPHCSRRPHMGTENDEWPSLNLWPLPRRTDSTMIWSAFPSPERQARLYCKNACTALLPNNENHILHEDRCVEGREH